MPAPVEGSGGMYTRLVYTKVLLMNAGYTVISFSLLDDKIKSQEFEFRDPNFKVFYRDIEVSKFAEWINSLSPYAVLSFNSKLMQNAYRKLSPKIKKISILNSVHFNGFYNTIIGIESCDALIYNTSDMYRQWRPVANIFGFPMLFEKHYVFDGSFEYSDNRNKLDPLNLIFVGRLEDKTKNIKFLLILIRALMQKKIDFVFNIVGDGPDKHLLEPLQEYKCVNLLGYLSERKRDFLMSSQDILIFPSFSEGFGLVLIEASYFGVLPIVNDLPHIDEVLGGQGIALPVTALHDWVDTIEEFSLNRDSLCLSQKKCQGYCKDNYSNLSDLSVQYLSIFESTLESKRKKLVSKICCEIFNFLRFMPKQIHWRFIRIFYFFVNRF
jgi:glycosyltransferase involved in cell wall biosynthesis